MIYINSGSSEAYIPKLKIFMIQLNHKHTKQNKKTRKNIGTCPSYSSNLEQLARYTFTASTT